MEIIIRDALGKIIDKGSYCFSEEQSRQEGKLSFFINFGSSSIEFFPKNLEEMELLVNHLLKIKESMRKKVENGEMEG